MFSMAAVACSEQLLHEGCMLLHLSVKMLKQHKTLPGKAQDDKQSAHMRRW